MFEHFFNANRKESKIVLLIVSRILRCLQVKQETIMIESFQKKQKKKKKKKHMGLMNHAINVDPD